MVGCFFRAGRSNATDGSGFVGNVMALRFVTRPMHMRIVDNCPVWAKALAAPVVLLMCFLAVGGSAFIVSNRSARELTTLSQVDLPKQSMVSDLSYNIMMTHVQASRYVAQATNGAATETLDELGRDVTGGLDMWKRGLTALMGRPDLSANERSTLLDLLEHWGRYHAAAESAMEAGAGDEGQALILLAQADEAFKSVAEHLLILSAVASNQTRLVSHDIVIAAQTNKKILAIGGLVGVLVTALLTIFVARSIVVPISAVTRAMQHVSSGDADGSAAYGRRNDEIGQMVAAIGEFRQRLECQNHLLQAREAELEEQNLRFQAALRNMSQGLSMFDAEQRLIVCNGRYAEMYGLTPEQVRPGTSFRDIIQSRIANGISYAGMSPEDYRRERIAPVTTASDKIHELSDGRLIAVARRPMADGGWVTTHEDITERRRIEMRIAHLAHHDALTDLPNRLLLRERLELATASERAEDRCVSVLMLDLDRFKEVNDTLGHPAGDVLLKTVAERLRSCVRETDTIARLGGDEFAIVHRVDEAGPEAAALAKRILELLSAPFDLNGHQATIGTSIGIALAPADGRDPDELLKNADLALYRAKSEGRGIYRFFEPEMDQRMQARRKLEHDLRRALINGEFAVHYQPLVNLEHGEVCGFEALLRWVHPERGNVPPDTFIPLAEETGLIVPIGEWVLRKACAEAASWPSDLKIAVNLSPAQFKCRHLVQTVISALATTGLAAHRLELEITETVMLQDSDGAFETLGQLHRLGVRVALDDFGTGYSSLSNLRKFAFDKIKIDRSFIRDLSDANVDAIAVVRSLAQLGVSLGIATTAEGVETKAQMERVRAEGCTEMQGYYICRPGPAADIAHFLTRHRKEASAA
jgi:diguanylate cyclase (GGDEF)-like protein